MTSSPLLDLVLRARQALGLQPNGSSSSSSSAPGNGNASTTLKENTTASKEGSSTSKAGGVVSGSVTNALAKFDLLWQALLQVGVGVGVDVGVGVCARGSV